MATLTNLAQHYNYVVTIFLMMAGLYIVIARGNMVKKLVGLSIFQTSVYLLYIEPGKIIGGTAPIIDPAFSVYSNPLPHVLILTAIVVGVATLALGLALVVRINEAYGTIEEAGNPRKGPRRMSAVWPHLPALQVVVPLIGAVLAGFLRSGRIAFALALLVSWITPVIAIAMLWQVLSSGPISYHLGGWEPPWGIEYRVDVLSGFVLALVSVVGAVIMPFARRSVAFEIEDWRQAWFYCMYLLCLTGLLGIAITGDAFNAFVFLEISRSSTYVLIALGPDRRALVAAFQYLIMGTIGATFYVIGVGLLYLLTGTLNMVDMATRLALAWPGQSQTVVAALAFVTVGVSLKLALFPLHAWLPNAYAYAPSWATAFLCGDRNQGRDLSADPVFLFDLRRRRSICARCRSARSSSRFRSPQCSLRRSSRCLSPT